MQLEPSREKQLLTQLLDAGIAIDFMGPSIQITFPGGMRMQLGYRLAQGLGEFLAHAGVLLTATYEERERRAAVAAEQARLADEAKAVADKLEADKASAPTPAAPDADAAPQASAETAQ